MIVIAFHNVGVCIRLVLLAFATLMMATVSAVAGEQGKVPFTVDDMLRLESFGPAVFGPDGRTLVYVHVPAMEHRRNQGLDPQFAAQAGEIRIVDVAAKTAPELLFQHEPGTSYWLGESSEDGLRVLVYAVRGASIRLGVYDFDKNRLAWMSATPALDNFQDFSPAWVSSTRLVYPALEQGRQPFHPIGRPFMASLLQEAWAQTWEGKQASVVVAESRADGGGGIAKAGRLMLADMSDGSERVLAEGLFSDLRPSPDGKSFAALKLFSLPQPATDRLFKDWWPINRGELRLISVESGREDIVLPAHTVGTGSFEWSDGGERLAFFAWPQEATVQSGMFHVYDLMSGEVGAWPHRGLDLVSERERGYLPRPERAAWLGDRLVIAARVLPEGGNDAAFSYQGITGRDAVDPGRADWFLLDGEGNSKNLTSRFARVSMQMLTAVASGIVVLADDRPLRIGLDGTSIDLAAGIEGSIVPAAQPSVVRRPFRDRLMLRHGLQNRGRAVVDASGTTAKRFDRLPEDIEVLAVAPDSERMVVRDDTRSGIDMLAVESGHSPVRRLRLNPQLQRFMVPEWKVVEYRTRTGQEMKSCLLVPGDYDSEKRYPVIVDVYPGTRAGCASPGYAERQRKTITRAIGSSANELMTGQGYLVLRVAAPSELIRTDKGPIAGMPDIVDDAVDALIDQGLADPQRVVLFGVSQGGISALWLATRSDRFKAIISVNGWSDLAGHYFDSGLREMLVPESMPNSTVTVARYESISGSDLGLGKMFWDAPSMYFDNSPLYSANRVAAPLMLIHSDMDTFAMEQYDAMFNALYRLRKPAVYLRYLGEGHAPSSAANIRDMWGRIFSWYGSILRDQRIKKRIYAGRETAALEVPEYTEGF